MFWLGFMYLITIFHSFENKLNVGTVRPFSEEHLVPTYVHVSVQSTQSWFKDQVILGLPTYVGRIILYTYVDSIHAYAEFGEPNFKIFFRIRPNCTTQSTSLIWQLS